MSHSSATRPTRDVAELFARTGISDTPTVLVAYGGPFGRTYCFTTTSIHHDPKVRRFLPHEVLDAKVRRSAWFHKDERVFPMIAASAAKVARAGGHVGIGSHGEVQGIGYHWEMWALASGGRKPLEVLRAATLHGAEAIGYVRDLGSLEPDQLADLLVLSKDPLADIHNTNSIRYVMKTASCTRATRSTGPGPTAGRCRGSGGGSRWRGEMSSPPRETPDPNADDAIMPGRRPARPPPGHPGPAPPPRESRTIRIMDVDEPTDEIDAALTRQERKTGPCELCGRPGQSLTFHHLIPRHCHRKKRFRSRFSLREMRSRGLWICRLCHGGIHDLIPDEKDLGWHYNSRESLLAHEGVRRHVDWVRKQK